MQHSEAGDDFSGLSMDKIALLGDIRFARVTISEFKVSTESISRSLSKKGRPPRPLTTKKWCDIHDISHLIIFIDGGGPFFKNQPDVNILSI